MADLYRANVGRQHSHLRTRANDCQLEEFVKVRGYTPLERQARQQRVHERMSLRRTYHLRTANLEPGLPPRSVREDGCGLQRVELGEGGAIEGGEVEVACQDVKQLLPRGQSRVDRDASPQEERDLTKEEGVSEPVDFVVESLYVHDVIRRAEPPQASEAVGREVT